MTNRIRRLAERDSWEVVVARSRDCAIDSIKRHRGVFNAALIDLMVPAELRFVAENDRLLENRAALGRQLLPASEISRELNRASVLEELDAIDKLITRQIRDKGGLEFLESAEAKRRILDVASVRIAIFSARPADEQDGSQTLGESVEEILGKGRLDRWFEKPVSLLDLSSWLSDCCGNGTTLAESGA